MGFLDRGVLVSAQQPALSGEGEAVEKWTANLHNVKTPTCAHFKLPR